MTWLCLVSFIKGQKLVWSTFMEVAEHHLESGSPPGGLEELHQGAELWAFNTDFSLEFPQPLMPYTVLVGGLLNQPAKPPEQVSCLDTHIQIHHWDIKTTSFCLFTFLTPTSLCFFKIPVYAQPSLIPTFTFLNCPYPNSFDPSGSSAVDLQFWRGRFHCCDSWINGLFRLCGPPANGAGCWLLQDPSGGALEVKGWHVIQE